MAESRSAGPLRLRVDGELGIFIDARRRGGAEAAEAAEVAEAAEAALVELEAWTDGDATVGHVVQTAGIPLTEVGRVRLDGDDVHVLDRARPGSLLRVEAVSRPQRAPTVPARFILDVHLGRLARVLRVLGVDTAYASDADDETLVVRAATQGRVLLTQDRGLLMRRRLPAGSGGAGGSAGGGSGGSSRGSAASPVAPWTAGYVRGSRQKEQLADVLLRWAPDLSPWSRCPTCNGELTAVPKEEVLTRLQPGTRRQFQEFAQCALCGAVFWHGAHAARLDALVASAERTVRLVRSGRPAAR